MKYVLLGNLNPEWATRQKERVAAATAKAKDLGIEIEAMHYIHGPYDYVTVIDAPDADAVVAFSLWYINEGYGRFQSSPAYGGADIERALSKL